MDSIKYANADHKPDSKQKVDFALIRINNDIKEYMKEKAPTDNCTT